MDRSRLRKAPPPETRSAGTGSYALLEYDGDQTRVRKTTAVDETLYFGEYERVTPLAAPSSVLHRYAVRSETQSAGAGTQE